LRATLGAYPAMTLKSAREAVGTLSLAVREGRDPQAERALAKIAARLAQPKPTTVADVAELWMKDGARRKAVGTLANERQRLDKHILPAFGACALDHVTRRDVRALSENLIDKRLGVTANRVVQTIGAIYRFAEDALDIAVRNPAAGMRRLHREEPRHRVLSDGEVKALWTSLESAWGPRERRDHDGVELGAATAIALALCLVTAQRAGEVIGMRADEIDLNARTWTLPAKRTKNRRQHVVPLSKLAADLIQRAAEIAGASPFVFPSPRNLAIAQTRHSLTRAMARACRGDGGLGIADASPHDLRRTAATNMASERLGISRYVVSRVLNHTSDTGGAAVVTQVYARSDDLPAKRVALDAWARLLGEIVDEAAADSNVVDLARRPTTG
jgi:integrase